jgi:hypothetical protein
MARRAAGSARGSGALLAMSGHCGNDAKGAAASQNPDNGEACCLSA